MPGNPPESPAQNAPADAFQLQPRTIQVAAPQDTRELQIRLMDWRRLHRKIKAIPTSSNTYANIGSILAGVLVTAGGMLLTLDFTTQDVKPWVRPTLWVLIVCLVILTVSFFRFAKTKDKEVRAFTEEVIKDMQEVHECVLPNIKLDS